MAAGVEETNEGDVGLVEDFYSRFRVGDISCFDLLDPEVEHETFIQVGDRIVVLGGGGRAKANGAQVEARFAHIWRCRDGRLAHCRNYVDSALLLNALEAPPPPAG